MKKLKHISAGEAGCRAAQRQFSGLMWERGGVGWGWVGGGVVTMHASCVGGKWLNVSVVCIDSNYKFPLNEIGMVDTWGWYFRN